MSSWRAWARATLYAVFCLALVTPSSLASLAGSNHECACGMKKSRCSCELISGRHGSCGGMSNKGGACSLRSHDGSGERSDSSPLPRIDVFDRLAILSGPVFRFEPGPGEACAGRSAFLPRSSATPPETPPPRLSSPAS